MTTIKWFNINIPIDIKEFSQKLKSANFTKEAAEGFLLKNVTSNEVVGRYIEYKPFTKEFKNPFGVSETITIPDFAVVEFKFTIQDGRWLLEVYNTPRSIKSFTNKISEFVGFGFYIAEIKLDLKNYIDEIESHLGKLVIKKMELYNINIENTALGQMLIKGEKDIRKSLESHLISQTHYKISSFKAFFYQNDLLTGGFEVKENSRLEIFDMPVQVFLQQYNTVFMSVLKNQRNI